MLDLAARSEGAFTTLFDFVERIDLRFCNKRVVEALVAAGACDTLDGHRKQLTESLDAALAEAQLLQAGAGGGARVVCLERSSAEGGSATDGNVRLAHRAARRSRLDRGGAPGARRRRCWGSSSPGHPSGAVPTRRSSCSAPVPRRR